MVCLSRIAWRHFILALTYCAALSSQAAAAAPSTNHVISAIAELNRIATGAERTLAPIRIEGLILWTNPRSNHLAIQDSTGTALLELDTTPWGALAGQRVVVEGPCLAEHGVLQAGAAPVVVNDGFHPEVTHSGTIFLAAGRHPFRLEYFNGSGLKALGVEIEGPGLPRQELPENMLLRSEVDKDGTFRLVPGLNYACFLGAWPRVPEFRELTPMRTGIAKKVDLSPRAREDNFGLTFSGWIEISQPGIYQFHVASDDGSKLWIGDSAISMQLLGPAPLPPQKPVDLAGAKKGDTFWTRIEGEVTFINAHAKDRVELEVQAQGKRVLVEVDDAFGTGPGLFSQVRIGGFLQMTDQGAKMHASRFDQIEILRAGPPGTTQTMEGVVLASSPHGESIIIDEGSKVSFAKLSPAQPQLKAGEHVRIEARILNDGAGLLVGNWPVIDHDGIHGISTKRRPVFLKAGKRPLRVAYFNGVGERHLEAAWEGPGHARGRIPDSALFHWENGAFKPGLMFSEYEGFSFQFPDIIGLKARSVGTFPIFSLEAGSLTNYFALDFRGFIEIPQDGVYTFSLESDDGSLLFIDESFPRVELIGNAAVAAPKRITPGQLLGGKQNDFWAEVEGSIRYAHHVQDTLVIELAAGPARMLVEVANAGHALPTALRNSRVRIRGACQASFAPDGEFAATVMRTVGLEQVQMIKPDTRVWSRYKVSPVKEALRTKGDEIFHLTAKIKRAPDGRIYAEDPEARICLEEPLIPEGPDKAWMSLIGKAVRRGTNVTLVNAVGRMLQGDEDLEEARTLTTIDEVKSLSRAQADRGLRAKIRGTITALMESGFFLQDATRSIYVNWDKSLGPDEPRVGDYWEVEGASFALFAPNVRAQRAVRLGPGTLPEPLRPSWDQLINGSLDTHFIEIEGVIASADGDTVMLVMRPGKLKVRAIDLDTEILKRAEGARVRLRGCYAPDRNEETQQVILGKIWLYNCSISIDDPAPADPFAVPLKTAADLLRFDTQAGALQRVKVKGQILHARNEEFFLLDGKNGLRFTPRFGLTDAKIGDVVEVVGFPELDRPSPMLREAATRTVAAAPLPPAIPLDETDLVHAEFDAMLVEIEGQLVSSRQSVGEMVLELQAGGRTFLARLPGDASGLNLPVGSSLKLTGVYAGQGGNRAAEREIDSFELLLHSDSGVVVLSRPGWWTLRHTAGAFGTLAFVLLAAAAWIKALRKRVEQRTAQLKQEIEVRRKAEQEAHAARANADAANQAKGQFLAAMSHEIRTPMNGVIGMTNLLLETGLSSEQREFAETSRQSAESLLTIINDILDFSKIEAGKLDVEKIDFNLFETVKGAMEILNVRAQAKTVKLETDIHPATPQFVRGDAGRLRQILLNLVGNGIKFTPELGEVFLNVKAVNEKADHALIRFSVRDTGIGIDDATRVKLFQPFSQADSSTTRKFGGTGLGLVISQRLAQLMGGTITVESEPGKGSIFTFEVEFEKTQAPPAAAKAIPTAPATPATMQPAPRDIKILLAEDNPVNRKVALKQLQKIGFKADMVSTGREVLEAMKRAQYDLILMDCQMPEMDGYEATRQLRADGNDVWVIAMTANAMQGDRESCLSAGMDDYITKPVKLSELEAVILRAGKHSEAALMAK